MILSCVMILVFLLLLIILAIKSRTFYPVIVKMFGIILIAFSLIMYAAKMSIYHTNIPIEYSLYMVLNRFKMTIDTIFMISNMGLICFLAGKRQRSGGRISNGGHWPGTAGTEISGVCKY